MSQETLDKLAATKAEGGLTKKEKEEVEQQAKKLRGVSANLAYARVAVNDVLAQVKQVANWDEHWGGSAEAIYAAERPIRSEEHFQRAKAKSERAWNAADRCVYQTLRNDPTWRPGVKSLQDILALSVLAKRHSCGNCAEMTARAFMILHTMGIRPLDFMALKNPADHAFVVIGRVEVAGKPFDPTARDWSPGAVVCDPWAFGVAVPLRPGESGAVQLRGAAFTAYSVKDLPQKMRAMHTQFSGVQVEFHAA